MIYNSYHISMLLDTFTVHDSHVKQQFNSTHNTGDTQKVGTELQQYGQCAKPTVRKPLDGKF